jgi:phage shock protein PspC (stress-responsive transcriptional regulator)
MNKTINVNIGGRVFNIEENAYDKLHTYLKTIRGYFEGNDSTDEIIADIELRIAELFMERTTGQKQVIVLADVDEVIAIMGKPEDYVDADEQAFAEEDREPRPSKQVFRDPDNKVVAGVCGGLSAYLGIDPIIMRVLFVVFTIFYGVGVLIYLLLAIIIPKAKTTAEKLRMRGEPVTVDNISRKVNESFSGMKEDFKDFVKKNDINKQSARTFGSRVSDGTSGFFETIGGVLKVLAVILVKLIGLVLLCLGISGIVLGLATVFGWESFVSLANQGLFIDGYPAQLAAATFTNLDEKSLLISGFLLTVLMPAIAFILLGIRLLFDFKKIPWLIGLVLIILWFVGIGMLTATTVNIAKDFNVKTAYEEQASFAFSATDTLIVASDRQSSYTFSYGFDDGDVFYDGTVTFPGLDSTDIMYIGKSRFTVRMNAADSIYQLKVKRFGRGRSQKEAIKNAKSVETHARLSGDSLLINPYYAIMKGSEVRGQSARYILHIPVGKAVVFARNTKEILDDVPNISNTYDDDMVGETWLMTDSGLECTSCKRNTSDH